VVRISEVDLPGAGGVIAMWDLVLQLFSESPNPIAATLAAAAAAAVLMALRNSGSRRRRWVVVAAVLPLAFAACLIASHMMETDRERIMARTRELLSATVPLDRSVIRRMIDREAGFVDKSERTCFDAVRSIGLLESWLREMPIASHEVREEAATLQGPGTAESSIMVWTMFADEDAAQRMGFGASRVTSAWRFRWRYDEEHRNWRVTQVQCTRLRSMTYPPCSMW